LSHSTSPHTSFCVDIFSKFSWVYVEDWNCWVICKSFFGQLYSFLGFFFVRLGFELRSLCL
jgi:hypothetical protein